MLYVWMILAATWSAPATQPASEPDSSESTSSGSPTPQVFEASEARGDAVKRSSPTDAPLRSSTLMRVSVGGRGSTELAQNDQPQPREPRIRVTPEGPDTRSEQPRARLRVSPTTQPADAVEILDDSVDEVAGIGQLTGANLQIEVLDDGTLIVSGPESDVEIIESFIEMMDAASDIDKDFAVIQLDYAQAKTLAPQIERLWNESHTLAGARGQVRPVDRITLIAEPRANVLLVAASRQNIPEIRDLVGELDVPSLTDKMIFTPFELEHINAVEAQTILQEMLEDLQKQRGATDLQINIRADVRTNSLLISAPEGEMDQIRHLIELIDVAPSPGARSVVKLAVYPLREAKAQDLADLLSNMLRVDVDVAGSMDEQIRMLQVLIQSVGGQTEDVVDLNLEKPIEIFADRGGNALVVATVEENIKPMGEIIRQLDTHATGSEMLIKMYPLEHADAEGIAAQIRDVFDQGRRLAEQPGLEVPSRTGGGMPGEALAYNVGVVADKRSNTVLVAGRPEQIVIIEKIIPVLDMKDDANKFHPRILTLEHADVEAIQDMLQQVADQWREAADRAGGGLAAERERVEIIPDIRTNSLIIVAREDNYERIVDLATRLDSAEADYFGQVRIIDLENLAASDIADKIEQLWERRIEQRRRGGLPEDKPVIVTDTRSNALIIGANNEDYAAIEKLIKQLEQQPLRPMQDIRQIILEHNSATKLADVIQTLFNERMQQSLDEGQKELPSDRVFLDAEPMTNTMLVVSSKANFDEILQIVNMLDVPPAVEGVVRTFYIRNADVNSVAEIIEEMFAEGIYAPGGEREIPEEETKVVIVPDLRSSALLISTSPQNFAIVEKLIDELDQLETPIVQTDARILNIEHADPVHVADMLEQLFEGMRSSLEGDQQDQLELQIIPDPDNRRILIAGPRYAMKRAEELYPKIDVRTTDGPTSEVQVYELEHANASRLATVLTQLFEERGPEDQRGKRTPITILPDEAANSLIVIASQTDHVLVSQWAEKLDVESTRAEQMRVFPLEVAKAEQIAGILTDLLEARATDAEEKFSVVPDPRTESLIVFGSPDLMRNVGEIIETLDNVEPKGTMEMRVFKLYNQKAEDLAERLDQFFESAGAAKGADARQLIIQFTSRDRVSGQEMLRKLVHQDITITPEPITNSLLILAPKDQIEMMEQLIDKLDSVPPVEARLEVFVLQNATASDMADLLENLFAAEGGGEEGAPRIILGGEGGPTLAGGTGDAAIEVAFGVDERTNSLIAAGSESILASVRKLVTELDYMEVEDRIVQVVRLNYASAEEVATTITDFYEDELSVLEEAQEGTSAQRLAQRRVTARDFRQSTEGEGESNVLLVSYNPRMESEIVSLVNDLDQPPPQVMVQVLMAEVTLDDRFEMGMEFALQDLLFSENATVGPNGIIQGPNKDFIGGTSVGASGESALGGFTFTITGEDFNFLLRALQSEGRVEVLSRPSIMVEDGKVANITVGERVPTVQDFRVDQVGATIPSVSYEDVGVILEVTPIINPDGYVSMLILPEISAIAQSSVNVGGGVTLPIFTKRSAETEVTVKDGETIIIGGLITSRTNRSENKVPLAGDVPILGNLFRANVNTTTKTELLMILTPHVYRTPEDARKQSIQMRDQTGLIDNIRKNPLMQKLQVKPGDDVIRPINEEDLRPQIEPGPAHDGASAEPMGPELDELGPEASSIEIGASRDESVVLYRR